MTFSDANWGLRSSPSIYVGFSNLIARDRCGTIGSSIYYTILAFDAEELSTVEAPNWARAGIPASLTKSFNLADLPCPPETIMLADEYKPAPGEPYRPVLAPPIRLKDLQPQWSKCLIDAYFQGIDPPRKLEPQPVIAPAPTNSVSADSAHAAQPGQTLQAPGSSPTKANKGSEPKSKEDSMAPQPAEDSTDPMYAESKEFPKSPIDPSDTADNAPNDPQVPKQSDPGRSESVPKQPESNMSGDRIAGKLKTSKIFSSQKSSVEQQFPLNTIAEPPSPDEESNNLSNTPPSNLPSQPAEIPNENIPTKPPPHDPQAALTTLTSDGQIHVFTPFNEPSPPTNAAENAESRVPSSPPASRPNDGDKADYGKEVNGADLQAADIQVPSPDNTAAVNRNVNGANPAPSEPSSHAFGDPSAAHPIPLNPAYNRSRTDNSDSPDNTHGATSTAGGNGQVYYSKAANGSTVLTTLLGSATAEASAGVKIIGGSNEQASGGFNAETSTPAIATFESGSRAASEWEGSLMAGNGGGDCGSWWRESWSFDRHDRFGGRV